MSEKARNVTIALDKCGVAGSITIDGTDISRSIGRDFTLSRVDGGIPTLAVDILPSMIYAGPAHVTFAPEVIDMLQQAGWTKAGESQ